MSHLPMSTLVSRLLARFIRAEQGNVAVIFTIALLPILTFLGAAIDYSRAAKVKASLQAALDSTALMVSRDLSQNLIYPRERRHNRSELLLRTFS